MSVQKGEPGSGANEVSDFGQQVKELTETAFNDRGEWYSIDWPVSVSRNSVNALLRYHAATVAAEVAVRNGRAYVRFHK